MLGPEVGGRLVTADMKQLNIYIYIHIYILSVAVGKDKTEPVRPMRTCGKPIQALEPEANTA